MVEKCEFMKCWVGECGKSIPPGTSYCDEHLKMKCGVCEEQATGDCDITCGPLVCGFPTCEKHNCPMDHGHGIPRIDPAKLRREHDRE